MPIWFESRDIHLPWRILRADNLHDEIKYSDIKGEEF